MTAIRGVLQSATSPFSSIRDLLVALAAAAFLTPPGYAHPAVGIVMDVKGNVYYTDLTHVWRVGPDGGRTIAVRNVHSHELYLDAAGNLYGEHLWYEGDRTKKWGHYIWRLGSGGDLETVRGPQQGFATDYSFVRDRAGAMYWPDRGRNEIQKRLADGTVVVLAKYPFRQLGWMTVTPGGSVYFTDDGDLLKVDSKGDVAVVAPNLRESAWTQIHVSRQHSLMGLWTDTADNVYVAVWGGRMVKRVAPDGTVSIVARSAIGWGPTGGLVAPNGDLWILETSFTNAVRVRRIAAVVGKEDS